MACIDEAQVEIVTVDYFLWALQRVHTNGEDRFLSAMAAGEPRH